MSRPVPAVGKWYVKLLRGGEDILTILRRPARYGRCMELATFPTRVILMPEHGRLLPLWDRSPAPDMWFGPFERNVLGLPEELETRLVGWNDRLVSLMGANQEWSSPQERLAFIVDGHLLAADVQREFGPDVPVLYQDADEENSRVPSAEGSGDEGRPAVGVNGRSLSPSPSEHPSSEAGSGRCRMPSSRHRPGTSTFHAILFPEADAGRSKAPAEIQQLVDRIRTAGAESRGSDNSLESG